MNTKPIDYIAHVRIDDDGNIVDFAVCESTESLDYLMSALGEKTTKATKIIRFKGDENLGIALREALELAIKNET